MMVCVLFPLVLSVLLTETSACLSPSGAEAVTSCPARWLLFGQRCFVFYPVWSSWSNAETVCTQAGGDLASLHTPEERQFALQLSTHTSVWLGGYQQHKNSSWFWKESPPLRISDWTNQSQEKTREGGACLQMDPENGELNSAPCGELRFFICSVEGSSEVLPIDRKPVESDLVPGVRVFDVVWSYSDMLAEDILRSSSFVRQFRTGQLTQGCYTSFLQQEALYLHRVRSTLEALVSSVQEPDDVRSLLQDTLKHYSSTNQTTLTSPPPPWLIWALQSFHSVVLEDPIYLLVALSARSSLRSLLIQDQELQSGLEQVSGSIVTAESLYQEWRQDSLKEVTWMQRYMKLIEEHRASLELFKAVNIFKEHMMNQKSFYKSLDCDAEVLR
ncbi:uncharacterized protein [Labrus bergylta]|uniref:uncharacterized protein n=1 Tax=Labrus bergylta TaxID=56723 RepID=UPI0033140EFF